MEASELVFKSTKYTSNRVVDLPNRSLKSLKTDTLVHVCFLKVMTGSPPSNNAVDKQLRRYLRTMAASSLPSTVYATLMLVISFKDIAIQYVSERLGSCRCRTLH